MAVYDSGNKSEVIVVQELSTAIQAEIDAILLLIPSWTEPYYNTPQGRAELAFSRSTIKYDAEEAFSFVTVQDDKQEISTPIILFEIDDRPSKESSVQGNRIYGMSDFSITVLVSRVNRSWVTYKQEVVDLVNMLENTFKKQTHKRILVGDIAFSDFKWELYPVSGAVIPISTPLNNYNYLI